MRKGSRKMWWAMALRSKKDLMRTESRMDIEEILKMKLETINEEPEIIDETGAIVLNQHRSIRRKKIHLKIKIRKLFTSQFSLKESYVLFITGFSSKGGLSRIPSY